MKTRVLFLLCLTVSLNVFSQILLDNDYNRFKLYFTKNQKENCEQLNKIPLELSCKILGDEIVYNHVQSVGAWANFECGTNDVFIVELGFPEGGYTSSYNIILINSDEKILKTQDIGSNMLDADGGYYSELFMINDSLLQIEKGEVKYDNDGVEVFRSKKYSYVLINDKGYTFVDLGSHSNKRLFPQSSLRILNVEELLEMDIDSLDIMRNEIFADYGYIFKTEKWKDYFCRKIWYTPKYKDVTDRLTIIERINIKNILKVTSSK